MDDDIVTRLERHVAGTKRADGSTQWVEAGPSLARAALAEIERLRAEIERLRTAGDGLVAALKDARAAMCDYARQGTGTDPESPKWEDFCMSTWEGVPDDLAAVDAAIVAWNEARREG